MMTPANVTSYFEQVLPADEWAFEVYRAWPWHLEDRARNHVRYREGLMNSLWDLVLYEWCIREKNLTLFRNRLPEALRRTHSDDDDI